MSDALRSAATAALRWFRDIQYEHDSTAIEKMLAAALAAAPPPEPASDAEVEAKLRQMDGEVLQATLSLQVDEGGHLLEAFKQLRAAIRRRTGAGEAARVLGEFARRQYASTTTIIETIARDLLARGDGPVPSLYAVGQLLCGAADGARDSIAQIDAKLAALGHAPGAGGGAT